jgi:D-arabinose 1-dehydrogenase-like Zn-dependent alcohol dehydrogenase
MRVEQRFVVPIPENVPDTYAAPCLLFAGATVFEPVVDYVLPGTKVAVASIGGLGTKAIQFAAAYGGHVTAVAWTCDSIFFYIGTKNNEWFRCSNRLRRFCHE